MSQRFSDSILLGEVADEAIGPALEQAATDVASILADVFPSEAGYRHQTQRPSEKESITRIRREPVEMEVCVLLGHDRVIEEGRPVRKTLLRVNAERENQAIAGAEANIARIESICLWVGVSTVGFFSLIVFIVIATLIGTILFALFTLPFLLFFSWLLGKLAGTLVGRLITGSIEETQLPQLEGADVNVETLDAWEQFKEQVTAYLHREETEPAEA